MLLRVSMASRLILVLFAIGLWSICTLAQNLRQPHPQQQQQPFEGFCPGRRAPPLKNRTCAPFYIFAACINDDPAGCVSSLRGIIDSIRSDNTTWDCLTSNEVHIAGEVTNATAAAGTVVPLPGPSTTTTTSAQMVLNGSQDLSLEQFSPLLPDPPGLVCRPGGTGCTALVKIESADVDCRVQNYFKRWLQATGWTALDYHFGATIPACLRNATIIPAPWLPNQTHY